MESLANQQAALVLDPLWYAEPMQIVSQNWCDVRGRTWLFHRLGRRRNSRWNEHDPTDMPAVQADYYNSLYIIWRNCLLAGLLLTLESIVWWCARDVADMSTYWRDGWHGLPCSLMRRSRHPSFARMMLVRRHRLLDGRRCCRCGGDGEQWRPAGTLASLGWSLNDWKPFSYVLEVNISQLHHSMANVKIYKSFPHIL